MNSYRIHRKLDEIAPLAAIGATVARAAPAVLKAGGAALRGLSRVAPRVGQTTATAASQGTTAARTASPLKKIGAIAAKKGRDVAIQQGTQIATQKAIDAGRSIKDRAQSVLGREDASVDYMRNSYRIHSHLLAEDNTSSKQAIRDRKRKWGKPGSGKQLAANIMRSDVKTDKENPRGKWVTKPNGGRVWVEADYGKHKGKGPGEQTKALDK